MTHGKWHLSKEKITNESCILINSARSTINLPDRDTSTNTGS
jgi:hypothetical protein